MEGETPARPSEHWVRVSHVVRGGELNPDANTNQQQEGISSSQKRHTLSGNMQTQRNWTGTSPRLRQPLGGETTPLQLSGNSGRQRPGGGAPVSPKGGKKGPQLPAGFRNTTSLEESEEELFERRIESVLRAVAGGETQYLLVMKEKLAKAWEKGGYLHKETAWEGQSISPAFTFHNASVIRQMRLSSSSSSSSNSTVTLHGTAAPFTTLSTFSSTSSSDPGTVCMSSSSSGTEHNISTISFAQSDRVHADAFVSQPIMITSANPPPASQGRQLTPCLTAPAYGGSGGKEKSGMFDRLVGKKDSIAKRRSKTTMERDGDDPGERKKKNGGKERKKEKLREKEKEKERRKEMKDKAPAESGRGNREGKGQIAREISRQDAKKPRKNTGLGGRDNFYTCYLPGDDTEAEEMGLSQTAGMWITLRRSGKCIG